MSNEPRRVQRVPATVEAGDPILVTQLLQVREACENKQPNSGHWYCTTHKLHFENNMSMHSHRKDHTGCVVAWICHEHGPEVP